MKIAADVLRTIEARARAAIPDECCGLLLGTADEITTSVAARNTALDPRRHYVIDPADHFAAIRQARSSGFEVVGAYHSHPRSAPVPSDTDRADAFDNFLFLIVGVADAGRAPAGPPEMHSRAWRLVDGNFTEVALVRLA